MRISSPLYEAALRGHLAVVKLILTNAQKVKTEKERDLSVSLFSSSSVSHLLPPQSDLNVTIPAHQFRTALVAAAISGSEVETQRDNDRDRDKEDTDRELSVSYSFLSRKSFSFCWTLVPIQQFEELIRRTR